MEALRASLGAQEGGKAEAAPAKAGRGRAGAGDAAAKERKGVKRARQGRRSGGRPGARAGEEVTERTHASTYTLRGIQAMLGLSRGVIGGLVASGFVAPSRGAAQRIPLHLPGRRAAAHRRTSCRRRRSRRARSCARCASCAATLPAELPLTGLRITAVGNDVAVRDGGSQWHADSRPAADGLRGRAAVARSASPIAADSAPSVRRRATISCRDRPDAAPPDDWFQPRRGARGERPDAAPRRPTRSARARPRLMPTPT